MTDDAVVEQRLDRAELLIARHLGIDAVQLPKPDLLHTELLAALERFLAQPLRPPIHLPNAGAKPLEPGLGGDQHAAIRMKRLADQLLRHVRPVGVRGIDEVDAKLRQTLQRADGLGLVFRLAPNAFSGDAHGAKAEAMDLVLAADLERP
jgi:hypothetical protein